MNIFLAWTFVFLTLAAYHATCQEITFSLTDSISCWSYLGSRLTHSFNHHWRQLFEACFLSPAYYSFDADGPQHLQHYG